MTHLRNSGANPDLTMSAMGALRAATAMSHRRLEKRLGVVERFGEPASYRTHLERMWGFCYPLEQQLRVESFDNALPDYEARRKLPSLTRDLIALGLSESGIKSLPLCDGLQPALSPSLAFGCAYVLEGATLGGRSLLPLVESRLGLNAAHGASYLASYEQKVAAMWSAFNAAVDTWCCDAERQARVTRAAVLTFDVLTDWLCENR